MCKRINQLTCGPSLAWARIWASWVRQAGRKALDLCRHWVALAVWSLYRKWTCRLSLRVQQLSRFITSNHRGPCLPYPMLAASPSDSEVAGTKVVISPCKCHRCLRSLTTPTLKALIIGTHPRRIWDRQLVATLPRPWSRRPQQLKRQRNRHRALYSATQMFCHWRRQLWPRRKSLPLLVARAHSASTRTISTEECMQSSSRWSTTGVCAQMSYHRCQGVDKW